MRLRRKYKAVRVHGYASRAEYARALELQQLEKLKVIKCLREQVPFAVQPETCSSIKYIADFVYESDGKTIVEDVKGFRTPVFTLKAKLFSWKYPQYTLLITTPKYRKTKEGVKTIEFYPSRFGEKSTIHRRARASGKAGKRHIC